MSEKITMGNNIFTFREKYKGYEIYKETHIILDNGKDTMTLLFPNKGTWKVMLNNKEVCSAYSLKEAREKVNLDKMECD